MENKKNLKEEREKALNSQALETEKALTIPVVEEQLIIDKELVESGKIHIIKKVHETTESINIPIIQEEVSVDRVAVNQYVNSPPPAVRQEGDKTIIPILKEVMVVEKKLLLVEEVHITRKQIKTSENKQETLKKEEIIIEREKKDLP